MAANLLHIASYCVVISRARPKSRRIVVHVYRNDYHVECMFTSLFNNNVFSVFIVYIEMI